MARFVAYERIDLHTLRQTDCVYDAQTATDALRLHERNYGHNYGEVVMLPLNLPTGHVPLNVENTTAYTIQALHETWFNGTQVWVDVYTNLSRKGVEQYMPTARDMNVGKPLRVVQVQPLNGLELA